MRLWHVDMIPTLPRPQLLGQHRECCALRGRGWGKKHSVVNYVFDYNYRMLFDYHTKIINEMRIRGYIVDPNWRYMNYRGKKLGFVENIPNDDLQILDKYPEHNQNYFDECIENLRKKGVKKSVR